MLIPVSWRRNQDLILIRLKKKRKIKIVGNGQIRLTVNQKRRENTPKKCLLKIFDIIPAAVEDNPKHCSVACQKNTNSKVFSILLQIIKIFRLVNVECELCLAHSIYIHKTSNNSSKLCSSGNSIKKISKQKCNT